MAIRLGFVCWAAVAGYARMMPYKVPSITAGDHYSIVCKGAVV